MAQFSLFISYERYFRDILLYVQVVCQKEWGMRNKEQRARMEVIFFEIILLLLEIFFIILVVI